MSFEDSQIDHFVPYSSPYILYWHNNKNKFNDLTVNSGEEKNYDSNLSDVERGRGDELSTSHLIQISAGNQFNLDLNHLLNEQINPFKHEKKTRLIHLMKKALSIETNMSPGKTFQLPKTIPK